MTRQIPVNLLIKKIVRVGHGFRNFGNYRLRSCCTAESPGNITPRHHYEVDYHA